MNKFIRKDKNHHAILIYLLTSPNNKQYVGITSQPFQKRWKNHIYWAKQGSSTCMAKAIRKYGEKSFIFKEIIKVEKTSKIKETESYYIHKYNTLAPNGYNMSDGGGGNWKGNKHSLETRAKMRKNKLEFYKDSKQKQKQKERMLSFYNSSKGKICKKEKSLFFKSNNPMKNPEIKKKINKVRKTPEYRATKSIEQKQIWSDPKLLKKHSKKLKEIWENNTESKKKISEKLLENHPRAKKVKIQSIIYPSLNQASHKLKTNAETIKRKIKNNIKGYSFV